MNERRKNRQQAPNAPTRWVVRARRFLSVIRSICAQWDVTRAFLHDHSRRSASFRMARSFLRFWGFQLNLRYLRLWNTSLHLLFNCVKELVVLCGQTCLFFNYNNNIEVEFIYICFIYLYLLLLIFIYSIIKIIRRFANLEIV